MRVVTLLCVMLCHVGVLAGCVVLCGFMPWCVVSGPVATRGVMLFCVASFRVWWVFSFVVSCLLPVALCSAVARGLVSGCNLARPARMRRVGWCRAVVLGPVGFVACYAASCCVAFCSVVPCCVVARYGVLRCVVSWCVTLCCLVSCVGCKVLCCVLL